MNTSEMGSKGHTVLSMDRGPDARERILEAAEALFAVRGFEGVSTTQIAKVAGITQPLIHYHFKNKEALWKCTVANLFGRFSQEFEADVRRLPRQESKQYLVEMIRCYVSYVARYPQFGQFVLREGVQSSPRLDWIVDNWMKPMLGQFQEAYDKGRTEGWLKDIPFPQMIILISASAIQFFSLAPLVQTLYEVEPASEEQTLAHSDAVVEMAINAIVQIPQPQPETAVVHA